MRPPLAPAHGASWPPPRMGPPGAGPGAPGCGPDPARSSWSAPRGPRLPLGGPMGEAQGALGAQGPWNLEIAGFATKGIVENT